MNRLSGCPRSGGKINLKDTESGLYYANARYYDPATARFTTEDPEAGKDLEPPSLHRYLYAYVNPTVYVDPTGRCANNWCAAGMAYGFAKTDEERAQAARHWVNSDPIIAGFAAAAVKTHNFGSDTVGWLLDAGSDDPDAQARQAARIAGLTNTLNALAIRIAHHTKNGQANNIVGAMAADAFVGLGQRTGENASEVNLSLEKRDYFGAWMAGGDLAGNVAEIATLSSAVAKPTAFVVTEARNSRVALKAAEAKKAEALLERKMQLVPDNDFVGDSIPAGIAPREPWTKQSIFNEFPKDTIIRLNNMEEQVTFLAKHIPGLSETQARVILKESFEYADGSSAVFGGSRVRGDFKPGSDLDVGFGGFNANQAAKVLKKIGNKSSEIPGALSLEQTKITPGNFSSSIQEIASPEEFFQRSGARAGSDARSGERYYASGSVSALPDGTIVIKPPRSH